MAIEEGRAWALKMLGPDGVLVREQIPAIIRECHERMANAQAEADMKHSGPYGYIWRRCLDEFSSRLSQLPSADLITVPRAGYKLVSFGGVVVFPWRFARERSAAIGSRPFAVSDTRVSLFTSRPEVVHSQLDFNFEHPEFTEEELALLAAEDKALQETLSRHPRVVVVAYASNPSSLLALHGARPRWARTATSPSHRWSRCLTPVPAHWWTWPRGRRRSRTAPFHTPSWG